MSRVAASIPTIMRTSWAFELFCQLVERCPCQAFRKTRPLAETSSRAPSRLLRMHSPLEHIRFGGRRFVGFGVVAELGRLRDRKHLLGHTGPHEIAAVRQPGSGQRAFNTRSMEDISAETATP